MTGKKGKAEKKRQNQKGTHSPLVPSSPTATMKGDNAGLAAILSDQSCSSPSVDTGSSSGIIHATQTQDKQTSNGAEYVMVNAGDVAEHADCTAVMQQVSQLKEVLAAKEMELKNAESALKSTKDGWRSEVVKLRKETALLENKVTDLEGELLRTRAGSRAERPKGDLFVSVQERDVSEASVAVKTANFEGRSLASTPEKGLSPGRAFPQPRFPGSPAGTSATMTIPHTPPLAPKAAAPAVGEQQRTDLAEELRALNLKLRKLEEEKRVQAQTHWEDLSLLKLRALGIMETKRLAVATETCGSQSAVHASGGRVAEERLAAVEQRLARAEGGGSSHDVKWTRNSSSSSSSSSNDADVSTRVSEMERRLSELEACRGGAGSGEVQSAVSSREKVSGSAVDPSVLDALKQRAEAAEEKARDLQQKVSELEREKKKNLDAALADEERATSTSSQSTQSWEILSSQANARLALERKLFAMDARALVLSRVAADSSVKADADSREAARSSPLPMPVAEVVETTSSEATKKELEHQKQLVMGLQKKLDMAESVSAKLRERESSALLKASLSTSALTAALSSKELLEARSQAAVFEQRATEAEAVSVELRRSSGQQQQQQHQQAAPTKVAETAAAAVAVTAVAGSLGRALGSAVSSSAGADVAAGVTGRGVAGMMRLADLMLAAERKLLAVDARATLRRAGAESTAVVAPPRVEAVAELSAEPPLDKRVEHQRDLAMDLQRKLEAAESALVRLGQHESSAMLKAALSSSALVAALKKSKDTSPSLDQTARGASAAAPAAPAALADALHVSAAVPSSPLVDEQLTLLRMKLAAMKERTLLLESEIPLKKSNDLAAERGSGITPPEASDSLVHPVSSENEGSTHLELTKAQVEIKRLMEELAKFRSQKAQEVAAAVTKGRGMDAGPFVGQRSLDAESREAGAGAQPWRQPEEADGGLGALQRQLAAKEKHIAQMGAELSDRDERLEDTERALRRAEDEFRRVEEELRHEEAEAHVLRARVNQSKQLENTIQKKDSDIRILEGILLKRVEELKALEAHCQLKNLEVQNYQAAVSALEEKLLANQANEMALQSSLGELKEELLSARALLKQKDAEVAVAMQGGLGRMQEDAKQQQQMQVNILSLQQKCKGMEMRLRGSEEEKRMVDYRLRASEQEVQRLTAVVEQEKGGATREKNHFLSRINTLKVDLEKVRQERQALKADLETLREDLEPDVIRASLEEALKDLLPSGPPVGSGKKGPGSTKPTPSKKQRPASSGKASLNSKGVAKPGKSEGGGEDTPSKAKRRLSDSTSARGRVPKKGADLTTLTADGNRFPEAPVIYAAIAVMIAAIVYAVIHGVSV